MKTRSTPLFPPPTTALTVIATLALTGCALSGGQVGSMPPPRHPANAGTLELYRDGSWIGIFGTMRLAINGQRVYDLGLNQHYSALLDPGDYIINYSIGLNDCSGIVHVEPMQTARFRLVPDCMMYPR